MRRRADVAWAIAVLWGLVLYQQINATGRYATLDNWLNSVLHSLHYPSPIAYAGLIGLLALATAGAVWLIAAGFAKRDLRFPAGGSFLDRSSRFRAYFLPVAYGLIPVVGADYFARQLPKFFQHAPRLVPAVQQTFGFAGIRSPLYRASLLSDPRIVIARVTVIVYRSNTRLSGWPAFSPAVVTWCWLACRVLLKIVYLLTCRVLGLAVLVFRSDRAKDAELLVLRHENAVLRRHAGRVRYEPATGPGLPRWRGLYRAGAGPRSSS